MTERGLSDRRLAMALLCVGCVLIPGHARAAAPPSAWSARGDEIVRLVRENFHDAKLAETWAHDHAGYAAGVTSEAEFVLLTKRAIAQLPASHTGFFARTDPEFYDLRAIFGEALGIKDTLHDSIGIDVDARHFVRRVFAGGAAEEAGLRRGDRIVTADGRPFDPVASFRNHEGAVRLGVERTKGEPPLEVEITPRRVEPKAEWLGAQQKGARTITRNGRTVAYVPMYSCAGGDFQELLQDQLAEDFRKADALVLDFRGGWGGCSPEFVSIFDPRVPEFTWAGRDGKPHSNSRQWTRKLVLLVDGGTRSGKEVVAFAIRKHRIGTLVGQHTAGAVVPGRCFLLSDGSLLELAVSDARVDGIRLEGQGVEPDVAVEAQLEYASGADVQLETAIDLAAR